MAIEAIMVLICNVYYTLHSNLFSIFLPLQTCLIVVLGTKCLLFFIVFIMTNLIRYIKYGQETNIKYKEKRVCDIKERA